jgi:hypothetical protein
VYEADDVLSNFIALQSVCENQSLIRQLQGKEAFEEIVGWVCGSELLGEGSNTFTLKQLLEITLPSLRKVQQAIATIEADRSQLSLVEPMWRTLSTQLGGLGPALQVSQRGRGAQAAQQRKQQVLKLVEVRMVRKLAAHLLITHMLLQQLPYVSYRCNMNE